MILAIEAHLKEAGLRPLPTGTLKMYQELREKQATKTKNSLIHYQALPLR